MGITKSQQVSFKVEESLGQRIHAAADTEDLSTADFVRKLFLWGFEQYESVGSLRTLRLITLSDELIEETLKNEREAYQRHRAGLRQKRTKN